MKEYLQTLRKSKTFLASILAAVGLILAACNTGGAKTTDVKITAPLANATINVGQGTVIQGEANGDNITRVEVVVDGKAYASLSTPDKTKGVPNFPVSVPWTPVSAGTHAVQLRAFGLEDKLLGQSEPLVMDAKATTVAQVTPTPGTNAVSTTVAPTTAPAATAASAATAAPAPTAANEGPKMTVTNDFVNVREGPNIGYRLLGRLDKGQTAPVRGKSQDGTWWQISYASGTNGVGWVFGDYVQANSSAGSVPVASAPPLPTQPPAPTSAPQIIVFPTVPPPTAIVAVPTVYTGPLIGTRGVLKVDANPIPLNGTVNASWSVSNIQGIWFDKGDGAGFQPAAGTQSVAVTGITGQRTLLLKWRDSSGVDNVDSVVITINGQTTVATVPVTSLVCNSSNSAWRGNSNATYTFCVGRDMDWADGGNPVRYFGGGDQTIGVTFNVFGVSGITLKIEPNSQWCGPAGNTGGRSVAISTQANGEGSYYWNVKDFGYGGYIVHLFITKNDGTTTYYNEKFMCVGNAPSPTSAATAIPTSVPSPTATHLPIPPTSTKAPTSAP